MLGLKGRRTWIWSQASGACDLCGLCVTLSPQPISHEPPQDGSLFDHACRGNRRTGPDRVGLRGPPRLRREHHRLRRNPGAGLEPTPQTSVVFDKFGNMYGTGQDGGAHGGAGMVWEITAAGVYKDLHDFGATVTNANGVSGPDGSMPGAGITVDANGNLFGTTYQGGPNLSAAGAHRRRQRLEDHQRWSL